MRPSLLEAARRGDHEAFRELVAPHRRLIYAHCHRMLGSSHDAEDAMQDSLLRAWRSLETFTGQAPLRAWLYRIATNVCLTAIDKRPEHIALTEGPDLESDEATEAGYEEREAAALAVKVTLNQLPVNQRAALILRDVLELPARDAAQTLGTTVASVNSALQRARANVDEGVDRDLAGPVGNDAAETLVSALGRGDVETVVGIAADAELPVRRAWSYSPLPAY